jgi:GNAT superfamily N-acetyltransferase
MVTIERVTDRAGQDEFLQFPATVYQGDAAWVPPLREWQTRRLSPRNPFFKEATLETFLARRGREVVGTVSALRDPRWEKQKNERTSFFGFFETIDDPEVAAALIGAAEQRARDWGMDTLRGPRNLTRIEDLGLTVDGFDKPPPLLASHHKPYYQRLVEGLGFTKHHDVLAYDIDLLGPDGTPRARPAALKAKADAVNLSGLEIRRARYRTLSADLRAAHHVFSEAFKTVPDTYPLPLDQFLNLGRALIAFTNRNMMQLVFLNGEPIAFAICVPEMNEAIRHARGTLFPVGWARFVDGLRHVNTASFKLIGVIPEHRKSGVHAKMIEHVVEGLRLAGYGRLEASLIDERNGPMRSVVEGCGMAVYRRYRIYDRKL